MTNANLHALKTDKFKEYDSNTTAVYFAVGDIFLECRIIRILRLLIDDFIQQQNAHSVAPFFNEKILGYEIFCKMYGCKILGCTKSIKLILITPKDLKNTFICQITIFCTLSTLWHPFLDVVRIRIITLNSS